MSRWFLRAGRAKKNKSNNRDQYTNFVADFHCEFLKPSERERLDKAKLKGALLRLRVIYCLLSLTLFSTRRTARFWSICFVLCKFAMNLIDFRIQTDCNVLISLRYSIFRFRFKLIRTN